MATGIEYTRHNRAETLAMLDEVADLYMVACSTGPTTNWQRPCREAFMARTATQAEPTGPLWSPPRTAPKCSSASCPASPSPADAGGERCLASGPTDAGRR